MRSLVPATANGIQNGSFAWAPDRLFEQMMRDVWGTGSMTAHQTADGAPLDIVELDDAIRISVEVPGIEPSDLDVSLTGQVLTLAAEKRDEHGQESAQRVYSERQYGSLRRSIKLPCPVEMDRVEAQHKNGVVTIQLLKSEGIRPRRIQVKKA